MTTNTTLQLRQGCGAYGDQQTCIGASDSSPLHYTGKMRDSETQLDYFGARYYASGLGHWMSPDWASKPTAVPYANFGDPQTLNLYGMVTGNPVSKQDSDGHKLMDYLTGYSNAGGTAGGGPDIDAPVTVTITMYYKRIAVTTTTVTLYQDGSYKTTTGPAQQTTSAAGVAFIEGWEGWNGTVDKKTGLTYAKDDGFGNGTIGWGHNCGKCEDFKDGITKAQGETLLKGDLAQFEKSVNGLGASLSQQQFDGLVSFAFNVRNYGSSTLFGNVSSGAAVTEANFTAYGHARVGGKLVEVPSLMARRRSEYDIYANGNYDSSH